MKKWSNGFCSAPTHSRVVSVVPVNRAFPRLSIIIQSETSLTRAILNSKGGFIAQVYAYERGAVIRLASDDDELPIMRIMNIVPVLAFYLNYYINKYNNNINHYYIIINNNNNNNGL